MDVPTSACTLLSTVHGRDRRALRQIGKRDLQAAVRHGKKEAIFYFSKHAGWTRQKNRWKYTFADVTYVTDSTSKVEITSWVVPLQIDKVPVSPGDEALHAKAAAALQQDPSRCTSHSVVVVDQSG
jgi:hypothetical protein